MGRNAKKLLELDINSRYRDLFKNNRDGIYISTVGGTVIDVNRSALEITGYKTKEEFLKQNTNRHYADPTDRVRFQKEILKNGFVQDFEVKLRKKNGIHIICHLTSTALKSKKGKVIGYQGIIRDVTKLKRAEERTIKSEKRYKHLLNIMNEGMIQVDNKDHIQFVNERFCEMVGYKIDELVGCLAYEILLEGEDRKFMKKRVKERMKGEMKEHYELKLRTKSGKFIWVYVGPSPVKDEKGEIIGSLGILTDITNRKIAEETLRKSENKFRDLFEGSPDAVFVESLKGMVLDANPTACAMHGLSYEKLLEKSFLELIPKEHREEVARKNIKLQKENLGSFESYSLIKSGKIIPIEIKVNKIDYGGEPAMILHVRDISERRTAEEKLAKTYEHLRNLSAHLQRAKEEESTRIGRDLHDGLGQVLTALKIDISLLHRQLCSPETSNGVTGTLSKKTKSMLDLVDSAMNSLRRISANLRPAVLDDMGLIAAVEWLIDDFRKRTKIKCVLVLGINDEFKDSMGVSTSIFRILQEALTNIIKHASATKVEIKLYMDGNDMALSVRDNGIGISEHRKKRINSFGLLGIKERAASHKGTFSIEGEKSKGSIIRVKIPMTK
ncbi:MAG TPA: PAS domain S-box protein [Flavobacteriales bacterium]|nr:PAS domain S-box protein [Flavobacteriales bacterium]